MSRGLSLYQQKHQLKTCSEIVCGDVTVLVVFELGDIVGVGITDLKPRGTDVVLCLVMSPVINC